MMYIDILYGDKKKPEPAPQTEPTYRKPSGRPDAPFVASSRADLEKFDAEQFGDPTKIDAEAEFKRHFESSTPAGEEAQLIDESIAAKKQEEIRKQAETLYNTVGQNGQGPGMDQYNYEGLVGTGKAITPAEDGSLDLPNNFIQPRLVEIAGYDLGTKEKVRTVVKDEHGVVSRAVAELHNSRVNTTTGAPIEDTAPLARVAYGFVSENKTFDEFQASLPKSYTKEQAQLAYRVADDQYQVERTTEMLASSDMPAPVQKADDKWDITDEELSVNEVWLNSAKIMYRNLEGKEWTGTDAQLHTKAKEMMSLFNWSVYNMTDLTRQTMNGPDDMKHALYNMMTLYDNKDTTGEDVLNNIIALGADPFSYVSLGFGKLAIKGAQSAFKKKLTETMAKYLGAAGAGAGEGAVYVGYDDFMRQTVELEAGMREKRDLAQTGKAAAGGAAAGTVLGPALVFGGEQAIKYGSRMIENYKALDMRGPRPGSPAAMRGSFDPRDAKLSPEEAQGKGVSSIHIIDQPEPPFVPDKDDVRSPQKQVGEYLQKRADAALRGRDVTEHTPENIEFISDVLAREADAEMIKDKEKGRPPASEWYRKTLDNARAEVGRIHPEVVTMANHRTAFDFALAITSNGQKVRDNAQYAFDAYEYYKKTGRMPERPNYGKGREANNMVKSFKTYNILLDAWGEEKLHKALQTEYSVRQLKDMGFEVDDEGADAMMPLSVIFGSKIGGGFFSNLQGDFTRLTPDRWFSRTWGRITGTMMIPNPELAKTHYQDFLSVYVANKKLVEEYLGYAPKKSDLTPELVDEMGQQIFAKWSRKKGPDDESFPDKDNPIHKLSRAIDGRLSPREAPLGVNERKMMRDAMAAVQAKLQSQGHDLNIADIQAILWYPEQRLWDQLGSKQPNKENDYARAFEELIGADSRAAGTRRSGSVRQASAESAFEGEERAKIAKTETLRNLRAGPRGQRSKTAPGPVFGTIGSGPKRLQLAGGKANVVKTHKVGRAAGNRLSNINVTTEPWHELEAGIDSSQVFHKAISDAKKILGARGAAVSVLDPVELSDARLFVAKDGLSGFAIKPDGNIVSVFNASKRRNSAISSLMLAVENGGTKLDCYDTALPHIYSEAGFRVVKRVKWDDRYTPDDWDFNHPDIKVYNKGRPDLVDMEYDAKSSGYYDPTEVGYAEE